MLRNTLFILGLLLCFLSPRAQAQTLQSEVVLQNLRGGFEPLARTQALQGQSAEIFFATNRNPIPETNPTSFGLELRRTVHFGKATAVSGNGEWQVKSIAVERTPVSEALAAARAAVQGGNRLDGIGSRAAALGLEATSPSAAFATRAASPNTDVLVYVHGAAHDFNSAISTAALIRELYQEKGRELLTLVFTYPTQGRSDITDYYRDREEAGMSGMAMATAFSRFVDFLGELRQKKPFGRAFFLAHSLGGYASRVAVQAVNERSNGLQKVFDAALLMAADEDDDTLSLECKLRPLFRLSALVTVYFAQNDKLLLASTFGNLRTPIGRYGPADVNQADFGDGRVIAIDAQKCSWTKEDQAAHRYYLHSPCAIRDIQQVFLGTPANEIPGRTKLSERVYALNP